MTNSLKINSGSMVPTDTIRFIKPIDDEERGRIAERYDVDGGNYNVSIQFADKSSKLATETLDEIRAQGVALINIGANRHVVAHNIRSADPFTKDDAQKLSEGRGYTLSQTFRSRIDTTAGTLLSSATPAQIMERRAKALESASAAAPRAAVK